MNEIMHDELFDRCLETIALDGGDDVAGPAALRLMHDTLVLVCAAGTRSSGQGFGNLFAQVDHLCRVHGVSQRDSYEIQIMRRHSNRMEPLPREELMYDVRALCVLISAVFSTGIPSRLVGVIPPEGRPLPERKAVSMRYVRCIVRSWDERYMYVSAEADGGRTMLRVNYGSDQGSGLGYLRPMLTEGMQLNLLDCRREDDGTLTPGLVVVEPDFLIDISSLAACFTDCGHHPLAYTVNRMRPRANSQAILLGNFAGRALDAAINDPQFSFAKTLTDSFREQALQFCTCPDFDGESFKHDARLQSANIREAVEVMRSGAGEGRAAMSPDMSGAMLEPSFVCERLGLQGRADLMTADMRLLVEQKSGKMKPAGSRGKFRYTEAHYVQLLLYYGVLRYNFGIGERQISIRLLYSRYHPGDGLLEINFYRELFNEAIRLRNRIVAGEYYIARHGFGSIMNSLTPDVINERRCTDNFYKRYLRPQTEEVTAPLHCLPPLERAYFIRMMTFVYREQLVARVGTQEGVSGAVADLWNMPLHEKIETGNILVPLRAPLNPPEGGRPEASLNPPFGGTKGGLNDELFTFNIVDLCSSPSIPSQGDEHSIMSSAGLPPKGGLRGATTFRRGDMIYLYKYDGVPDVRSALLYKGTIEAIDSTSVTVRLNNPQHGISLSGGGTFAIEHASSDVGTTSSIRGLHAFVTAPADRRALLLGQREPRADMSVRLSRSYSPHYDDILLRSRQAFDYFLLVGPPGTGKTSMALRFMVEEELKKFQPPSVPPKGGYGGSILLMSYTNRAVDEICSMLCDAGIGFLRIGGESSCDPRFRGHLLEAALGECPRLDMIRQRIMDARVIVATTSTLQSRPFVFDLKHFSLAIVDEASQILEPSVIGLLAAHRDGRCSIDRFVLVGDHKQLPAVVQQPERDSRVGEQQLRDIGLTDCRNSLFERLLTLERRAGREQFVGVLRRQGRMHPGVARLATGMFYARERLEPVPCPHQLDTALRYDLPARDALDGLLKSRRMLFIPSEPCLGEGGSEKVNVSEARIVADVVERIQRFYGDRFDPSRTIGIIVPYRNQIAAIRSEMERRGLTRTADISIDTVERYQGSQRDVIVYSFTVQRRSQLAFLTANCFTEDGMTIDRKLNVAMTRARHQMIMTGNEAVLRENAVFARLIDELSFS